jgi:hypothetical protein
LGGLTASALLAALSPNYALAEQVKFTDPAIVADYITYPSPQGHGTVRGYLVRPANASGKLPAVVVVHHANKSGGYRGTTAIKGGVDLLLRVESATGSEIVQFTTDKARLIKPRQFAGRAVWQDSEFWLAEAEVEQTQTSKLQKVILEYLSDTDADTPTLQRYCADELGANVNTARKTITDTMPTNGWIAKKNPGAGRGVAAIWTITARGRRQLEQWT